VPTQVKIDKVSEIAQKVKKAGVMIVSDYRGVTVNEIADLRKTLSDSKVELKVYKNTLLEIATKDLNIPELNGIFKGPTIVAFSESDPVSSSKILSKFAKENTNFKIKGGVINAAFADLKQIATYATLPSKNELIARLVGSIKSSISKFVYVLHAIEKKKGESAPAASTAGQATQS
jgi:large subunit ribosomal protein L10